MPDARQLSGSRALAAALYRAAVEGAAPFPHTRDHVRAWLRNNTTSPTATASRVHCLALGKASTAMMAGALSALESHAAETQSAMPLAGALVVTSHAPQRGDVDVSNELPDNVRVCIGDHPVPGPASLDAADAIGEAVRDVAAGDIVLVLLSGGTTALTAAPLAEFSQQVGDAGRAQAHIANLAQTLLESGLAIHEMNAIRRRVLRWGGGRLAAALHARGAKQIAVFAISDVIGDDPSVIGSGPCSPETLDDTAFLALLDAHDLRSSLERDMAQFLGVQGDALPPAVPQPGDAAFTTVSYEYVARNRDAVASLERAARAAGIQHVFVEETPLEGEAADRGDEIGRLALRLSRDIPRGERAVWVIGGEPVVHLRSTVERALSADEEDGTPDEPMKGGRMQALALSAALRLEERALTDDAVWRVTILAAGTDGRDGPTDAAGAIVDGGTPLDARRRGRRRPERDLDTGRSWFSLDAADALLRTGPTGTNVMDVVAILIDR